MPWFSDSKGRQHQKVEKCNSLSSGPDAISISAPLVFAMCKRVLRIVHAHKF